ncbi:MAG: hypothetical protein ABI036_10960, partial [Fibrobacteria bacterium]
MCGIFGLILGPESRLETAEAKSVLAGLFRLSESRGKEAAGLAVRRQGQLLIHKQALSAGRMLATSAYSEFIAGALAGRGAPSGLIAIGHSRLVTNGSQL